MEFRAQQGEHKSRKIALCQDPASQQQQAELQESMMLMVAALALTARTHVPASTAPPHILFVVCDDLVSCSAMYAHVMGI
jgi:hypothetical protein